MAVEAAEASGESPNPEEHRDGQLQEAAARAQQYPLARQSSLLSLTLDEIQRSVFEPRKTLGSMNVDDFLANIWTNDEGTAMASAVGVGGSDSNNHSSGGSNVTANNDLPPPTSLCREGSLSIPATLCRKTADEVWSEIQRNQRQPGRLEQQRYQSSGNSARQPPFGEMTLEDFLIKAGVVQEGGYIPCSAPQHLNQFHLLGHHQQQKENNYGLHGSLAMMNERSGYTPTVSVGYGVRQVNPGATTANGAYHYYQEQQQQGGVRNGYGGGGGGDGYAGGGGIGDSHIGVGSPVSTASSDGFGCGGQVDYRNPSGQRGADTGGVLTGGGGRAGAAGSSGGGAAAGRKRVLEGLVEKVKERRQRRMIKNRESAARSRARKQAYTVELYTQLNQLKDENARLQEEQRRLVARRQQMLLESMAERSQRNLQMNAKTLRQCCSCVW